jgi:hypothetical protein
MPQPTHQKPIRAGIFASMENAEHAVRRLVEEGIDTDQISVVCSDDTREKYFEKYQLHHSLHHSESDSERSTILKSGLTGGVLGGLVALSGVVTNGGIAIAVVGPILIGGITGTLLGLLVGRGVEDEVARFYDQSVGKGEILVAVDIKANDEMQAEKLALVSEILEDEGTKPLPLEQG